ncbi:MAG: peptidoglycan bridge formation glycyltransferase FemA/FemB family protein [Candidatus Staskawiczbacteria bacterium]|nr:peptidoglycan bridge formation glycyltransferase FemA/FemB family protein [Candidatus Staskawiczbacteria bacterium]
MTSNGVEIKEITNKDEWQGFLLQCADRTFLHSWNWGEFNLAMQGKIWRFGTYSNEKLVAVVLILKISARRGIFLFIPHGPVVIDSLDIKDKKEVLELILLHISNIAKEEKASFIRVSPIFALNEGNNAVFEDLGFRPAPIHMHPELTWELSINASEEELLKNMRKTTRYLIRQAEKNPDIKIIKSNREGDLDLFWPVYEETAKRHGFVVFPKKYLNAEFNSFSTDREILIFLGKYKEEIVSVAIFVFWQNMCFYHHSGSLSKHNKIPVSYLLQWEAIKEAKAKGCTTYNFWGIAPDINTEKEASKSKHPWAGLSLFKMGFGGYRKEYVKTQDFVLSQKYWINYIIEKIRKRKRNL